MAGKNRVAVGGTAAAVGLTGMVAWAGPPQTTHRDVRDTRATPGINGELIASHLAALGDGSVTIWAHSRIPNP